MKTTIDILVLVSRYAACCSMADEAALKSPYGSVGERHQKKADETFAEIKAALDERDAEFTRVTMERDEARGFACAAGER